MWMISPLLMQFSLIVTPLVVQPSRPPAAKPSSVNASSVKPPAAARKTPADGAFFTRRLERTNVSAAMEFLKTVSPQIALSFDEQTNTLIGYLSAEDAGLVNRILNELECRADPPAQRAVQLIPLRYRNADRMIGSLQAVVSPIEIDARLAADKERNMILAAGGPEFLKSIADTVRALDTPSLGIPMEFALLTIAGDSKNTQTERGAPLPADLKAVGEELAAFGELKFLGRVSANANVGSTFAAEGTLMMRFEVIVQGELLAARDEGAIDLRFQVIVKDAVANTPQNPVPQQFKLDSTITAMAGDTLVLGSAPAGKVPGDAMVLVLRFGPPRGSQ